MSRAVIHETFGGPEVLEVREVPEPHAGPGEVRIRVAAVGLNPMDWAIARLPELAARFGITLPGGFGTDFAGRVDEVGDGVTGVSVGERVYGGAIREGRGRAHRAEHAARACCSTRPMGSAMRWQAPLPSPAGPRWPRSMRSVCMPVTRSSSGALRAVLASSPYNSRRLVGARVIGTASEGTFDFLRRLGAEPVAHGAGLVDRVGALASDTVTAATDLFGTEVVEAALALGVRPERISTVAAGPNPPGGARPTGASEAQPAALERITDAIVAGSLVVPIAATFPLEQIRDAVTLQASRHVHGKVVITI